MNCRKIKRELTAYVSGELSRYDRQVIEAHLKSCSSCQKDLASLEATREMLKLWGDTDPAADLFHKFEARLSEESTGEKTKPPLPFRRPSRKWAYVLLVAACLAVAIYFGRYLFPPAHETSLETAKGVSYQQPADIQIGFYIAEHERASKQASFQRVSFSPEAPFWIPLRREDLLYYDTISGGSEEPQGRSGLILKGGNRWGKSPDADGTAESQMDISDGEILSLAEAREAVSFHIVAPAILSEGYRLTLVKKAPDREYVQLVYSSGASAISLFQQPVVAGERLSREDFREYVLRLTKDKQRTAVLGWHTKQAAFNVVGEGVNLPDLMKIADEIQERYVTDGVRQYYQTLYEEE